MIGNLPVVAIMPIENACQNATPTFSADVTACDESTLNYLWEFPTVGHASATQAEVNGLSFPIGQHEAILTVTNACGSTKDTARFAVFEGIEAMATLNNKFGCLGRKWNFYFKYGGYGQ